MHEEHRDRMRKKIVLGGGNVEDHELLETLLYYALPRINTNPIAHNLLDAFGSLNAVLHADAITLMQVEGVGEKTAVYLSTLGTVYDKCRQKTEFPKIFSFEKIRKPIIELFSGLTEEVFTAFFLDKKQHILARKAICSHSAFKVDIDLNDFAKQVVLIKPCFMVIAHNHLSGDERPSLNDDKATENICLMLKLYNVNLVDHIIVAGEKLFSYYYENRIDTIKERVKNKLV